MMSSRPGDRSRDEAVGEAVEMTNLGIERADGDSERDVSASSQDPLNQVVGRNSPPPVPLPPPPPNEGAPPEYSDPKPPEYHEAVGLLQAHRLESINDDAPPQYLELEVRDQRDCVSPSGIDLDHGSRRSSLADEEDTAPPDTNEEPPTPGAPDVDVERGSERIRRRLAPVFDYVKERRWLLVVMPLTLSALVIFLAIFPVSFKYIHFYDMALKRSRWTGWVDFSRTYYSGCYVIGPEMEFLRFPATTQSMKLKLSVITSSTLSYYLHMVVVYRLNGAELPKLYRKFAYDYEIPLKAIIGSTVKNTAANISMDAWFHTRLKEEQKIEAVVRERLQPYHIDVFHVYLHEVVFPKILLDRMMKRVVLDIETDTERYILGERMESKMTEKLMADVTNEAEVVAANAAAEANKIGVVAGAIAVNESVAATAEGIKGIKSAVSLANSDQVLSFYLLSSLRHMADDGRLLVTERNVTKSLNTGSGSFAKTLAAAASLAKSRP